MKMGEQLTKATHAASLKWLLAVIASLLSVFLLFDLVIPSVVMAVYKDDYSRMVVNCQKALRSADEARNKTFENDRLKNAFYATVDLDLLNCTDHERLKNELLSWRVAPASVRAVEIGAVLQDSSVPVKILTAPYAKPK